MLKFSPEKQPQFEKPEQKQEKQKELERIRQKLEEAEDNLGKPIEQGIFETVVMLRAFGLKTDQSCEGHSKEKRTKERKPSFSPWVDVHPHYPERENWQKDERLRRKVEKEAQRHKRKMIELLDEFYEERKVSPGVRICLTDKGIYGGFRLQSSGSEKLETLSDEKRKKKREVYKQEMEDFTDFLREKYFSE